MKQFLLAFVLLAAWLPARAQSPAPVAVAAPYRYCALLVDDRYFSDSNRLALDYGQAANGAPAEPEMAEMAKNIRGSTSVIDALNYLSRHGWELLTVTNVPTDIRGTGSQYITSETRYLHRRRVAP